MSTPPTWSGDPREDPRIKDDGLKRRFAAEQLRQPGRDYHIALGLIPEGHVAAAAVNTWRNDPVVIAERLRLQNDYGERAELPTKETVMLEILALGRETSHMVSDRLKAYALYSELNNYTGRNSGVAPQVNLFSNKVMLLRDHGSQADWEAGAKAQQANLVKEARADAERNQTTH